MLMIGSIIKIEENIIEVELSFDITKSRSIIGSYILLKDVSAQFIGELFKITGLVASIRLIGEYEGGRFLYGTVKKPSFGAGVYIVSKDFIPHIIGSVGVKSLTLGKASLYDIEVGVDIDSLFGSHFAIFGATGSGKSCGFARMIQNVFYTNPPRNAKILIFDAYGEYKNAFSKFKKGTFKNYTTNIKSDEELLKIPLWLLNQDDLALLLNAQTSAQLLILDKTLRFVNVFAREDEEALKYKNSIIASALLDILSSGRSPVQIRDHVLSLLARYNTKDLNTETKIVQPGYTRTIKLCMMIDASGKINSIELVEAKLQEFVIDDVHLTLPDGSFKYTLNDLLDALDFALIDEGVWKSEEIYDSVNFLKIRLQNLIKNDTSRYFEMDYISNEDFIKSIFKNEVGEDSQIVNFNINYIDDRFAKTITKIYSRIFYDYVKELPERASMPINIILEEAHRYVQNDRDVDVIGYNIFERICKEGRKYGILMGFISQRPTELSETCISQCANFLLFKMTHAKDLDFIRSSVPYITDEMIEKIKTLMPGTALTFGKSFNLPTSIDFTLPEPTPSSENAEIEKIWYN